ncbi:MAG: hypothetical protein JNL43_02375 [Flavobacteriales bacterium]|nr:hypothetical protein [Flavobacteriales bacterium]
MLLMFGNLLMAQGGALILATGYHHIARQDQVFSPMIHRGSAFPNVGLTYTHEGTEQRHAVRLGYDGYSAGFADTYSFMDLVSGSEETTARSAFTIVDLSYELQWHVGDTGRTQMLVGGGFFGQLGSLNHGYAYPSFGYTIFLGIGPTARLEHALNERTRLHADLSLPFLSWVARSPYALNDDQFIEDQRSHKTMPTLGAFIAGGRWASFGSFRRALLVLGAEHRFATRWSIGGKYSLEYLDVSRPARLISFRNGIDVCFTYHFRKS